MIGWLRSYDRRWLRGDLVAGVAVAALIVPKNLGYAGIAGIPLQNGLYAAAAGAILYPVFGTSRQISTGPSSGLAAVAASAVVAAGVAGNDVASLVAAIALASGVLFLLLAVFKMGWIANFLSRAVVTGFLFGAAIDVVIGELPKLTGTEVGGSNPLEELRSWFSTLGDASLATVLVGAVALAVIFGLRFVAPRVPGALVLVVGGLVASRLLDLSAHGVALVGHIPRGLPNLELPSTQLVGDHASTIALAAVALVLIGFSQTAGDSRMFAARHHYRIDINQESIAQGMANVGAGLFQGMPVSTSLSASSLNDHSGARSGLASLTSGVIVLLTLLVLAPFFSDLPKAVLAALIIEAVVMGMMDIPEMRRLAKVARLDFWIAVAALAGTLVFGVLTGVVIGIGLSLVWLISVATRPHMPLLGREPGTQVFREIREHPADEQFAGIIVVRLDGGLFFATADALEDRVREVALSRLDTHAIVLDCEGIDFIDSQGSAKLREILELTQQAGVTLRLARLKPAVRDLLQRDGVLDDIGTDRTHTATSTGPSRRKPMRTTKRSETPTGHHTPRPINRRRRAECTASRGLLVANAHRHRAASRVRKIPDGRALT
jgi:high affinity sulfate transporter 1